MYQLESIINTIIHGNSLDVLRQIPDACVDMAITSPPYYGKRDYSESTEAVWGGNPCCEHEWGDDIKPAGYRSNENRNSDTLTPEATQRRDTWQPSTFCSKCGAWKGQLGLEPTPSLYIQHLVQIFTEVMRVLKPYGSLYVNLGDTYNNNPSNSAESNLGNATALGMVGRQNRLQEGTPTKSLLCIPDKFKIAMVDVGWTCRNDLIWYKRNCLCGSTILYASTQKGVMPSTLKDLVRLKPHTVQLWDGQKWERVKEWIKNPNPQNIKEITFRNNEVIKCTGDHLFPLIDGRLKKAVELKIGDVIKNNRLPPEIKEVEYLPDEIGWFLGVYLADGSIGGRKDVLQFASHTKEQERFDRLKKIAGKYGANCYAFNKEGNSATFNICSKILVAIVKTYIGGNTAKNKHLTNATWQRNNNFLNNLLIGYLSGDGYHDKGNNRYRLCFTRNHDLARDLRLLCARMGYSIKLQKGLVTAFKGIVYKKYYGEIRFIKSNHHNQKSDYEIIDIKTGRKAGHFWDIVLEHEPHLFASHSGLLIHNCMPSSADDRFTEDYERIFFFVKSNSDLFWTNEKTMELATKPPKGTGGIEGTDWCWIPCPNCNKPKEAIQASLEEPDETPQQDNGACKRCGGIGRIKQSYWQSHDYYFEQQFEPIQESSVERNKYAWNSNQRTYSPTEKRGADYRPPLGKLLNPLGRNKRTVWDIPEETFVADVHGEAIEITSSELEYILQNRTSRTKASVWDIVTKPLKESHYASYPRELIETPIRASCPEFVCKKCGMPRVKIVVDTGNDIPKGGGACIKYKNSGQHLSETSSLLTKTKKEKVEGGYTDCGCGVDFTPGIVLDMFMGSGTTAITAKELGRRFIGSELNPEYIKIAEKRIGRIKGAQKRMDFFEKGTKEAK